MGADDITMDAPIHLRPPIRPWRIQFNQALKLTACRAGFALALLRFSCRPMAKSLPRTRLQLNAGVSRLTDALGATLT